ncbi:MAG: hypothetical protein AB7O56_11660 [Bauldia sp.]
MRSPEWRPSLEATINRYSASNFAWGNSDCVLFALDVIQSVSGRDLYREERGAYSDEKSADARLAANGFAIPEDVIAAHCPEIPVASAEEGDLGVVNTGKGTTLCVFKDDGVLAWTFRGLRRLDRAAVLRAYRVA